MGISSSWYLTVNYTFYSYVELLGVCSEISPLQLDDIELPRTSTHGCCHTRQCQSIGSKLGFSVVPKDWDVLGFKPPTFSSFDNSLDLVSFCDQCISPGLDGY